MSKSLTAHWHPSLRPLIEDQDPSQTGVFRLLSSDPNTLRQGWEPNARVTLIDNTAHAMEPSTASGAVTALKDAQNLSGLIKKQGGTKESIGKYEEEMREYTSEAVATSANVGQKIFGLGAIEDAKEVIW